MYKKFLVGMMTAITVISMATVAFAEDAMPRYTNTEIKNDIYQALKKEERKTIVPPTVFVSKETNLKNDSAQNNLTIAFSTSKTYPITVSLYRIDAIVDLTPASADDSVVSKDKKAIVPDKNAKKLAEAKDKELDKKFADSGILVYGPEDMASANFGRYYHPEKNPKLGTYKLVINQANSKEAPVLTEIFNVVSASSLPAELKENVKAPLIAPGNAPNPNK